MIKWRIRQHTFLCHCEVELGICLDLATLNFSSCRVQLAWHFDKCFGLVYWALFLLARNHNSNIGGTQACDYLDVHREETISTGILTKQIHIIFRDSFSPAKQSQSHGVNWKIPCMCHKHLWRYRTWHLAAAGGCPRIETTPNSHHSLIALSSAACASPPLSSFLSPGSVNAPCSSFS